MTNKDNTPDWLSIAEFAAIIGFEPRSIRGKWLCQLPGRYVLRGPGKKGHYRIHRKAIDYLKLNNAEKQKPSL